MKNFEGLTQHFPQEGTARTADRAKRNIISASEKRHEVLERLEEIKIELAGLKAGIKAMHEMYENAMNNPFFLQAAWSCEQQLGVLNSVIEKANQDPEELIFAQPIIEIVASNIKGKREEMKKLGGISDVEDHVQRWTNMYKEYQSLVAEQKDLETQTAEIRLSN